MPRSALLVLAMDQTLKKSMCLCGVPTKWPVLLPVLLGGDCHSEQGFDGVRDDLA